MEINSIINTSLIIAFSLIPVSLLSIQLFAKIFSRHSSALAKTTTICTTMLGTLTKDTLKMRTLIFDRYKVLFDDEGPLASLENKETKDEIRIERTTLQKEEAIRFMAAGATLCRFHKIHNLEHILTDFFIGCGINSAQIREKYDVISKIPSDENKKFSSTVAINRETKEIFSFNKGHALTILKKCSRILINGKKIDLNNKLSQKLGKAIKKLNEKGEKTLAFAYKPLPFKKLDHYSEDFVENDLVLLGITGLGDIINSELAETIAEVKELGIKTYLLSGTKEQKSIAIGHELKISSPRYFEAIGKDHLKDLGDEQISKMLANKEKDYTFFMLTDEDKKRIIEILTKNGEIVALCDGKNGQDLKNILNAIKKDRNKKTAYRRMLLHSLTCKLIEVIILITALLFRAPLPLSIVLILSLDIVINIMMEATLSIENKDGTDKGRLLITGITGGIITSAIYIWSLMRFGWTPGEALSTTAFIKSSTMAFLLLTIIQIVSAHDIKTNPLTRPYLSLVSLIAFIIIYMVTHFQIFKNLLNISALTLTEWEIIIFAAILTIIIEEIRKYANSKK